MSEAVAALRALGRCGPMCDDVPARDRNDYLARPFARAWGTRRQGLGASVRHARVRPGEGRCYSAATTGLSRTPRPEISIRIWSPGSR